MKKIALLLTIPALLFSYSAEAQNVGINETGNPADASAGLDVDFNNKGVLIPRVALTQTTNAGPITAPVNALLVYNTATVNDVTPGFYYWFNGEWVSIGAGSGDAWELDGNAGTNAGTNFLGTTDAQGLDFRTNNTIRMRVGAGGPVWVNNAVPFASTVYSVFALGADNGIISEAINGDAIVGQSIGGNGDALVGINTGSGAALFTNSQGTGEAIIGVNSGTARTAELVTLNAANNDIALAIFNEGTGRTINAQSNNTTNVTQTIFAAQNTTNLSANAAAVWGQSDGIRGGVLLSSAFNNASIGATGQYIGGGNIDAAGLVGLANSNAGWGYGVIGEGNWYALYGFGDFGVTGGKFFEIDHPLDPENKILRHANIESNEILNHYRGNVILDQNGEGTIELPDYFHSININFSYQLTPVGASMPNLYVSQEIADGVFKVAGGEANKKVSWVVQAERNDKYMTKHPDRKVMEKEKKDYMKGKYLDPISWGQPESKGISNRFKNTKQNNETTNNSITKNYEKSSDNETKIND